MTQNNIKVAITGGIGSGKSTVSEIIRKEGYTVISCDEVYGELLSGGFFNEKLADLFGKEIIKDGAVDKKSLAEKVFSDSAALQKLNRITHPAIMEKALSKLDGSFLGFIEVPLLFENGFEALFDEVIVVLRNYDDRVLSVSKRDKTDEGSVKKRIFCQFDYNKSDFAEYYVIHNDGNLGDLQKKTVGLVEKIRAKYL